MSRESAAPTRTPTDLLRQYSRRRTDVAAISPEQLDTVAAELNGRPRKTLGWMTPAER
jgi:transposase, IS30 family